MVEVTLVENWHRGLARDKMERIHVSAKAMRQESDELATRKEKEKIQLLPSSDVDDIFLRYLHAYR